MIHCCKQCTMVLAFDYHAMTLSSIPGILGNAVSIEYYDETPGMEVLLVAYWRISQKLG